MLDSRLGKIFIILYAIGAITSYALALTCGLDACGHYIIYPILPWAYILAEDFGLSFPWVIYPVLALLNISVFYAIGVSTEWLYHRYKERAG